MMSVLGNKDRKRYLGLISFAVALVLVFQSLAPLEVRAEEKQYANSLALEALLNERAFVVQALKTGARDEEHYGGRGFANNPHFYMLPDHFLYESLMNEYKQDPCLKSLVDIYKVKSTLENYPLETLVEAGKSIDPFVSFLGSMLGESEESGESENASINSALCCAYEAFGGTFPTVETLKWLNQKIKDNEDWADYEKSGLENISRKDGSPSYFTYKDDLEKSDDKRDGEVLAKLEDEETAAFKDGKNIFAYFIGIIEGMQGTDVIVDGVETRSAKIYDVILNDIFMSEHTSSLGMSVGKESEAKAEMDECTQVLKNEKEYLSHMGDLVDLDQSDSAKVMVDDYLKILKDANERKVQNINAALGSMKDDTFQWYPCASPSIRAEETSALYQEQADEILKDVKKDCDELYLLHSQTAAFIGKAKEMIGYVTDTLENYYLIDMLVRENEYIRGVLERSAAQESGKEDAGWQDAVEKYRTLLDMSDTNVDNQIFLSILQTASEKADKILEKKASKLMTSTAARTVVNTGKDAVARAKIAQSLSHISVVYTAVDILDDYVVGMQDAAEKIFEIEYLLKMQDYVYDAYLADVEAYHTASDPFEKDMHAGNALADLQFLKQIKLKQIEDAYQTFDGLKNETIVGHIVQFYDNFGGDTMMEEEYRKEMDAITQMMVCPVGGTPYKIEAGNTLTIKKVHYSDSGSSYFGTVRDSNNKLIGSIAEIDLLAAGGLDVEGTLIVDADVYLPELIGQGKIQVAEGADPYIGHISGDLTALSDLHVKGSVNGSVIPGARDVTVEIDGNVYSDRYIAKVPEDGEGRSVILIHGNLNVGRSLTLWYTDITVEGKSFVSVDMEADSGSLGLLNSVFHAKDEFTYAGYSDVSSDIFQDSRLELWDMGYFPLRAGTFGISDTSAIVIKDSKAGLVGTEYVESYEKYGTLAFGNPKIKETSELSGPTGLIFETDRVRCLKNVSFEGYEFPENLHVTEDSSIVRIGGNTLVNGLTFESDLTLVSGGEINARGITVNGDTHVAGHLEPTGFGPKNPGFLCHGSLYVNCEDDTFDAYAKFYQDTITEGEDTCYTKIDGNVTVDNGTLKPGHMTVDGDVTLNEQAELEGETSNSGSIDTLIVNGLFTHKGVGLILERLILRGGADIQMQPPTEDYKKLVSCIYLEQGDKECQEFRFSGEDYTLYELHVKDAVCSFPEGLTVEGLEVDDTLTVRGEIPFFHAGYQKGPGQIVFEEDVNDFSLDPGSGGNRFQKIWAKKNLRVTTSMFVHETGDVDGIVEGILWVDGDLIAADGVTIEYQGKEAKLGCLTNEGDGKIYLTRVRHLEFAGIRESHPGFVEIITGKQTIWTGGDIELSSDSETQTNLENITLKSDRIPRLDPGDGELIISKLAVNGAGLSVDGKVKIYDITSPLEELVVEGDLSEFSGGCNVAKSPSLKRIVYRDAKGMESGKIDVYPSDDFCWNVEKISVGEDAVSYNATQYLRQTPENGTCRVRYCYGYGWETVYYELGSLIFPYAIPVYPEEGYDPPTMTIIDPIYEDQKQTKPVSLNDLTTRKLTDDLDLFYQFEGELGEDDSQESDWKLYQTEEDCQWAESEDLLLELPIEWFGKSYPLSYRWYRTNLTDKTTEMTAYRDSKWYFEEAPIRNVKSYRCDITDPKNPERKESITFYMTIDESQDSLWGDASDPDVAITSELDKTATYTKEISEDSYVFTVKFTGGMGYLGVDCEFPVEIKVLKEEQGVLQITADYHFIRDGLVSFYGSNLTPYYIEARVKNYDGSQDGGTLKVTLSSKGPFSEEREYIRNSPLRMIRGFDTSFWTDDEGVEHESIGYRGSSPGDVLRLGLINGDDQIYRYDDTDGSWVCDSDDTLNYYPSLDFIPLEDDFPYTLGEVYMQKVGLSEYDGNNQIVIELEVPVRFIDTLDAQAAGLPAVDDLGSSDAGAVLDFKYTVEAYERCLEWSAIEEYGYDPDTFAEYQRLSADAYEKMKSIMGEDWDTPDPGPQSPVEPVDISTLSVTGIKTSYTYTGSAIQPSIKVKDQDNVLVKGTDYTVSISNNKNVGTATVLIEGIGNYCGTLKKTFKIVKAENTLKVKARTGVIKYSSLKKKNQTLTVKKVLTISKARGKLTYRKVSGSKKITINKTTGKVTVKKGLKKGSYKIKVKVTAAGTAQYKSGSKTVTFTVKVK